MRPRAIASRVVWCVGAFGLLIARSGHAQVAGTPSAAKAAPSGTSARTVIIDGSPAPVPPELITRDRAGRVTVRASRLTTPLRLDGRLDEEIYTTVPPISAFIQSEPHEGQPATEKTEFWVFFDDTNMYVACRCWETDPKHVVANELRRDGTGISGNDSFAFSFDTFYDRRSLVYFQITPIGGWIDGQATNGSEVNTDWNPVWTLRMGKFDGGWTLEAAVPFKSLRYPPGQTQIWGFNARRVHKWKNEIAYLSQVPNWMGTGGIVRPSVSGTLVGVETPAGLRNLDIKPYATSSLLTNAAATPKISNDVSAKGGLDVKYGVTKNLTADFTYNTDFAQVEADEQQVNLTRFNLTFPEKREFFLENRGTFSFGAPSAETPNLFYSRRIGLNAGREVPIVAGGRLTGRVGRYDLGLLDMQTGEERLSGSQATNFSVVRVKRDILRRSQIGAMFTGRSVTQSGIGGNQAYGLDATIRPFDALAINTYWARTHTDGVLGDDASYRAQLDYSADRYGAQVERLVIGSHFDPQVGFLQRHDVRKSFGLFRFSPRLQSSKSIRKLSWTGSVGYIGDAAGQLETRDSTGAFAIQFQKLDQLDLSYNDRYEFLPAAFPIAPGITLPAGRAYHFGASHVDFILGPQRAVSAALGANYGAFYSGHKTGISASGARVKFNPHFSVEPSYSGNWVVLKEGSFATHLVGSRVTYAVSAQMFASALLQYNSTSHSVAANVRFRWEYQPGSELFVVLNEQRDTSGPRFPALANRSFVVKINRLFRL